jgi:hypothetical protein
VLKGGDMDDTHDIVCAFSASAVMGSEEVMSLQDKQLLSFVKKLTKKS